MGAGGKLKLLLNAAIAAIAAAQRQRARLGMIADVGNEHI